MVDVVFWPVPAVVAVELAQLRLVAVAEARAACDRFEGDEFAERGRCRVREVIVGGRSVESIFIFIRRDASRGHNEHEVEVACGRDDDDLAEVSTLEALQHGR